MPNQNGEKTAADLDLSHIPGIGDLGLNLGGQSSGSAGAPAEAAPASEPAEPVDYSQYTGGNAEPVTPEPAAEADPQEPGLWDPLLQQVPEPLHEVLTPTLQEYERQLSRRDEQLAPFAEWVQRGLTPQDIVMALQTQQQILANPHGFWQDLGQRYGWAQNPQQFQQQFAPQAPAAPAGQPPADPFADIFGDAGESADGSALPPQVQQVLQTVLQQNQQLAAQFQAQQQQQQAIVEQQQNRARVDADFQQLEAKYGALDEETRQEVARRAIANYHAGIDPSITRAFHELRDYENKITQRYARTRPQAPVVVGGGNGSAPPAQIDLSTPDKRAAAAYALAVQMGADGAAGGYRE